MSIGYSAASIRSRIIFGILATFSLLQISSKLRAQSPDSLQSHSDQWSVLIGGNLNAVGLPWGSLGWGTELVGEWKKLSVGIEYGQYATVSPSGTSVYSRPISRQGDTSQTFLDGSEQYLGARVGFKLKPHFVVSLCFLVSHSREYFTIYDTMQTFNPIYSDHMHFDIALDMRGHISNRLELSFAYSYRRGLKAGLAYCVLGELGLD